MSSHGPSFQDDSSVRDRNSDSMNPFPGLRPFDTEEHHLFFGREKQTAALLTLLRQNRFLAVVGSSGSGKSSLVRAGLIPALHRGTMTQAGSAWEVLVFRPGGDPLTNLAHALLEADIYDAEDRESLPRLKATLTRSHLGLIEAVRQADSIEPGSNLLIIVDQFEELFRFRAGGSRSQEAAGDFVSLLLAASQTTSLPIFIALTMRSDYLGDCSQIQGLAQSVNRGEFLIPRLTRDQKREAIEKPIGVGNARIAPRLTQQMLNDVGDDPDQLPILQHALMRTWDAWTRDEQPLQPIDLEHYESIGGMKEALSLHADEIFASLRSNTDQALCERLFRALTENSSDNRGVRRPTRFSDLELVCRASRDRLLEVMTSFRSPGVTFLMPGLDRTVDDRTVIDISHESLMRVWQRLRRWVEDEAQSARIFRRLTDTATLWKEDKAGLYHNPDLGIAQSWWKAQAPNEAWALQYGGGFAVAQEFLEESQRADAEKKERFEEARQRELAQAKALADTQSQAARTFKRFSASVAVLAIVASALAVWAFDLWREADRNRQLADEKAHEASVAATEASNAKERTQHLLVESRHNQGQFWIERAHRQLDEKEFLGAKLMAAKAIGFEGFGRSEASEAFCEENPHLLRQGSIEWREAEELVFNTPELPLIWSSASSQVGRHVHPALNHDGSQLVCSDHTATLARWDTVSGRKLEPVDGGDEFHIVRFLSNGLLASSTRNQAVVAYDPSTGERVNRIEGEGLVLDSEGKWILQVVDEEIQLLSTETGAPLSRRIPIAGGDAKGKFSVGRSQRWLVAAHDRKVDLVDLRGEESSRTIGTFDGQVELGVFSRNGDYFVLIGRYDREEGSEQEEDSVEESWMKIWSTDGFAFLYETDIERTNWSAYALTESELALGQGNSTLVYDIELQKGVHEFHGRVEAISGNGKIAAVVCGSLSNVLLWDTIHHRWKGHAQEIPTGAIETAFFSADGRQLLEARANGIWARPTMTGEDPVRICPASAEVAAASSDGRYLVTGETEPRVIRVWRLQGSHTDLSVQELARFEGVCTSASFAPVGARLVVGLASGEVKLIDLDKRKVVQTLEPKPVESTPAQRGRRGAASWKVIARFDPGGSEVAVIRGLDPGSDANPSGAALDVSLELWRPDSNEVHLVEGGDGATWVSYSARGKWLAWTRKEQGIRLLNRGTGQTMVLDLDSPIDQEGTLCFNPDEELLAIGGPDLGRIQLWDLTSKDMVAQLPAHLSAVAALDFSPDGRTLLSASTNGNLKFWEVVDREKSVLLDEFFARQIVRHPDQQSILIVSGRGQLSRRGMSGRLISQFDLEPALSTGEASSFRLNRDGTRFLARPKETDDHQIDVRDLETGEILAQLSHPDRARGVFDPQGEAIVTISGPGIFFWNAETFELTDQAKKRDDESSFVAIDMSPDGKVLALADRQSISVWDAHGRKPLWQIPADDEILVLRFQPGNGGLLACLGKETLQIVRAIDGSEWDRLAGSQENSNPFGIDILDWSPDGSRLLHSSRGRTIAVWDAKDKAVVRQIKAEGRDSQLPWSDLIVSGAFSPDGNQVVYGLFEHLMFAPCTREIDPSRYAAYLDIFRFKDQTTSSSSRRPESSADDENDDLLGSPSGEHRRKSGELTLRLSQNLYSGPSFSMRPLSPESHISLLRSLQGIEADRALLASYIAAENWEAAAVILREMERDDRDREGGTFLEAIARAARATLQSEGEERPRGVVERWLQLAEEFDPEDSDLAAVRLLLDECNS